MAKTKYSTRVTQGLCALAFALTTQVVQAAPQWQLNPEGTGLSGASALSMVNVGGVGFVQVAPDANDPSLFSFVEHGAYQVLQPDLVTPFGTRDLTVAYSVSGIGSVYNPFALRFTSGSIDLYADPVFNFASAASHYGVDDGTHVASFNVFDGRVQISGLVTVDAKLASGSLLSGYLFDADGSDLANRDNVFMQLGIFNQPTFPDNLLVSGVVCGLAAYAGPGCDGTPFASSSWAYTVRDGGYATISVPEPQMLSLLLFGLGLISFATKRRRSSRR